MSSLIGRCVVCDKDKRGIVVVPNEGDNMMEGYALVAIHNKGPLYFEQWPESELSIDDDMENPERKVVWFGFPTHE